MHSWGHGRTIMGSETGTVCRGLDLEVIRGDEVMAVILALKSPGAGRIFCGTLRLNIPAWVNANKGELVLTDRKSEVFRVGQAVGELSRGRDLASQTTKPVPSSNRAIGCNFIGGLPIMDDTGKIAVWARDPPTWNARLVNMVDLAEIAMNIAMNTVVAMGMGMAILVCNGVMMIIDGRDRSGDTMDRTKRAPALGATRDDDLRPVRGRIHIPRGSRIL